MRGFHLSTGSGERKSSSQYRVVFYLQRRTTCFYLCSNHWPRDACYALGCRYSHVLSQTQELVILNILGVCGSLNQTRQVLTKPYRLTSSEPVTQEWYGVCLGISLQDQQYFFLSRIGSLISCGVRDGHRVSAS